MKGDTRSKQLALNPSRAQVQGREREVIGEAIGEVKGEVVCRFLGCFMKRSVVVRGNEG